MSVVLPVTIIPTNTPPPDEDLGENEYRAATTLNLTCQMAEAVGIVAYQWRSTCDNCFASANSTAQSIISEQLLSSDTGTHTCNAMDSVGNTGIATFMMTVVGESALMYRAEELCQISFSIPCRCWLLCC